MADHLLDSVKLHEGFRSKPYKDSVGVLTIGYGTNLEALELTEEEASYFLNKKVDEAKRHVAGWKWADGLNDARRDCLVEMCYNLGPGFGGSGAKSWPHFQQQVSHGQYDRAAENMRSTLWARQVGNRAKRLALQMETGHYWQEGR